MFDGRGSDHSPIDANTMQTVSRQIVGVLCHNQGDNDHVPTIHKGFDVPMLVFVIIGRGIAFENLQVKPDHLLGMKPVQKLNGR